MKPLWAGPFTAICDYCGNYCRVAHWMIVSMNQGVPATQRVKVACQDCYPAHKNEEL